MGQATSSAAPVAPRPASASVSPPVTPANNSTRRSAAWRRSFQPPHASLAPQRDAFENEPISTAHSHSAGRLHSRSASLNRLSQFLSPHSSPHSPAHQEQQQQQHDHQHSDQHDHHDTFNDAHDSSPASTLRPSRLQRARTSLNTSIANLSNMSFRRHSPASPTPSTFSGPLTHTRATTSVLDFTLPDVSQSGLDLDIDSLTTTVSAGTPGTPRTPSRRSSLRLPNGLSDRLDRFTALRSDRPQRSFTRRRRSPNDVASASPGHRDRSGASTGEDNTALLSRLLSVAAAATAATLLEGNQQAIADARSVAGDGDDGTFNSFLQSLESGRLAAALRGAPSNNDDSGAPNSTQSGSAPLNFFRMFRFGSLGAQSQTAQAPERTGAGSTSVNVADGPASDSTDPTTDGRMVPIIIVGIRSVNPGSGGDNAEDNGMPPFLDALSALPTTPFGDNTADPDSIDGILRSPQNGTHFTHRRRASMGGANSIASGYDAQRHHMSPERAALRRPISAANDSGDVPRPPPATPATPALSRLASTASTAPSSRPGSLRSPSRRESIIRTTTTTMLESTSEDAPLRPRASRQRRLSESDYRTAFSSRRNGIVEPDTPNPSSENTRSWIIYVLGGSYPENHPILTTPSLFTDSPTYEDMMLLSALLGPAKPPVASDTDVASAGGIFTIETSTDADRGAILVAVAADQSERVELVDEQRCLVCLCDFEDKEQARQLVKCKHLFHKECIDEWLTKGRNSCPLCRGQGVDEQERVPVPLPSPDSNLGAHGPSDFSSSDASFADATSTTE